MVFMLTNEMKQYARYLLKSNKRLCTILWVTLFAVIPFLMIVLEMSITGVGGIIFFTEFCGYALACLTPIFLFRFIYQKRSSDLYLSLPIKRKQLFFVTYFTGFFTILIPVLINLCISVLLIYMFREGYPEGQYISSIITPAIIMFILYAIVTWVVQQCNNLLDGIFVSGCYMFIPLLCIGAVAIFLSNQYNSFMIGNGSFWNEISYIDYFPRFISIVYYLITIPRASSFIMFQINWQILAYWFIISIICIWFACKSFEQRRQEDSEQRTTVWWTYPLIIGVLTFCLILMIVNTSMSSLTIIVTSIAVFVLYICMICFSKRKIQITLRSVLLFGVLFISTFSFSFIFQETKGFHIVKEVPSVSNISKVEISIYNGYYNDSGKQETLKIKYHDKSGKEKMVELNDLFAVVNKEKQIEDIVNMQKVYKDEYDNNREFNDYTNVSFNYTLKNGRTIYRDYNVDKDTVIKDIEALFNRNAQGDTLYKLEYRQSEDLN